MCLFTHAHADHFDAGLVRTIGCTVVGPSSVTIQVSGTPVLALSPEVRVPPLKIVPTRTEHGPEEHDSYLVEWNGLRLYFTGDTDSTSALEGQERLDALLITPWLLAKARSEGGLPSAAKIIVDHHRTGEKVPPCPPCLVPSQGQSIELTRRLR